MQRKIWNIDARDILNQDLPGNLLVLAANAGRAVEKATRYLKKNYPEYKIENVTFEGEIDIF
jgi:hypothetical protein